ncbi:MAG: hypothetical protein P1V20_14345 [Verrucomicrobiales bacterium]|nr:hypothetical protein [Verrucomicrobiales bacterium]
MTIQTPDLPTGSFKYTIVARDSTDATKSRLKVVTGIRAGANLTIDMRDPDKSAAEVAAL